MSLPGTDRLLLTRAVEALAALPDGTREWLAINHQGGINRIYAGQGIDQGMLIVQRRAAPIPGVDFRRERRILALVRHYSWAPRLLAADNGSATLLFPRYAVTTADAPASCLLRLLGDLQGLTAAPALDYGGLPGAYATRLRHRAGAVTLCGMLARELERLPAQPACLVHHDLHPGNVLVLAHAGLAPAIKVIDWENAGRGSPWLDMAAAARHWRIGGSDFRGLPATRGMSCRAIRNALASAAGINELLTRLWQMLVARQAGTEGPRSMLCGGSEAGAWPLPGNPRHMD